MVEDVRECSKMFSFNVKRDMKHTKPQKFLILMKYFPYQTTHFVWFWRGGKKFYITFFSHLPSFHTGNFPSLHFHSSLISQFITKIRLFYHIIKIIDYYCYSLMCTVNGSLRFTLMRKKKLSAKEHYNHK